MQIFLGADHGGFKLKTALKDCLTDRGYHVTDCGAEFFDPSDDFNSPAQAVATHLAVADRLTAESTTEPTADSTNSPTASPTDSTAEPVFGILICASGQGMAMQANRFKHVRAALCRTADDAALARAHNHANLLCLAGSAFHPEDLPTVTALVETFLTTAPLPDAKYLRRALTLDDINTVDRSNVNRSNATHSDASPTNINGATR